MFKTEKGIIVIMVIFALIIFVIFVVKTMSEESDKYKMSKNNESYDYKIYGFISDNSLDSIKMQSVYKRIENKFNGKMNFEMVNVSENSTLSNKYKVHVVPAILIIDKYGNVVKRQNGVIDYEQLSNMIAKIIEK